MIWSFSLPHDIWVTLNGQIKVIECPLNFIGLCIIDHVLLDSGALRPRGLLLIDNIYVEFGGHVYQQTVGIPMGSNCVPLVVDLFLYSYEVDFVQHLQNS